MNVYTNKSVLINNWYEDKYGTLPSKNEGNNWDSTYQRDYPERVLPIRDNRVMRNIRERASVNIEKYIIFYIAGNNILLVN